jgi:uncharacterized protein (TIGR03545 family)
MKIPAIFKKKYSEKNLNKKILRHAYLTGEKTFLSGLFKKGEDGLYALDLGSDESKETSARLKNLAKAIKANRSLVSLPKIALLLAALGGIGGTYYYLRNSLIEKALEGGLETVFGARADVKDLDFDIFAAKITWSALEVADRDRPMKNLFELGPTTADLHMAGLLRGRFIVEKLESRNLRRNTDRSVSGALPDVPKAAKPAGPTVFDFAADSAVSALSSIDPKALLEKEYDKLATPKTAERLKTELEALKAGWEARISTSRKEIEETGAAVKEIAAVDLRSIKTPDAAIALYNRANAMTPKIQALGVTAAALKGEFDASLGIAETAKKALEKAVADDYAYVESLVSISGDDAASLAKGLFSDFLAKNLGAWYDWGLRGVDIAKSLAAQKNEEKKPESPARLRGRDIPFAFREALPKFWIRTLAFDGSAGGSSAYTGKIENITVDPDLVGKPVSFSVDYKDKDQVLGIEGTVDGRRNAATAAEIRLSAEGYPARIALPSPMLTIKSLRGPVGVKTSLTFPREGGMRGRLDAAMTAPAVERSGKGDAVSDLAYSILTGVPKVDAAAEFAVSPKGSLDLRLSSSLDKVIKEKLNDFLKEQEKKYKAMVKAELQKRFESLLAENAMLRSGYAELQKAVGGNVTDVAAYRKAAEDKKKEIEKRVEDLKKELTDELKKQATDALLKEAQKIAPALPPVPELPKTAPSIPSTPPALPKTVPSVPPVPSVPKPRF